MQEIYFKHIHAQTLEKIDMKRTGAWICMSSANQQDIAALADTYNLDVDILIDCLDEYEVPRVESDDENNLYIFTRFAQTKGGKVYTSTLLIVYAKNYTFTLSKENLDFIKIYIKRAGASTTQKSKLILHFFKAVNDSLKKHIYSINRKTLNLSHNIERITNKEIAEFVEYEKTLNEFISALVPFNMVFRRIKVVGLLKLFEEDQDFIEDLELDNEQLVEMSKSSLKNIVNTRDSYMTIVTNSLNKNMKKLTALTIILMIPTIITGFYGMNVNLPFAENPFAYLLVILTSIGMGAILMWLFVRKDMF